MCWPASARHPGQSSPSTMSYSFPVPLPAPPPPLPARCRPPAKGCPRTAVPAGAGLPRLEPPARAGTAPRAAPQLSRREARSSVPARDGGWTRGRMVHLRRPGPVRELARSHPAPPGMCPQGSPPPAGRPEGSARHCRLPGKMCSSPAVFPPACLFLSTHLFSFSSHLYFKDDVRPSTSLPSPPPPPPLPPPRKMNFIWALKQGKEQ